MRLKHAMQGVCVLMVLTLTACAGVSPDAQAYYLGEGKAPRKMTPVTAEQTYTPENGCGWLNGKSNLFAVQLPEGNYDVTVAFENEKAAAAATVKAEARRVMLRSVDRTDSKVRRFTVNVRRPEIKGGDRVRLNSRETGPPMVGHWDELLTLEFLPGADAVQAVQIEPVEDAVTVYIAGDSTVTDQRSEPWTGWGQVLPSFFEPGVAVANHSESGRALYSFRSEKRLAKILSTIQPGDYLFIQFGHNDQKNKAPGSGPFTSYAADLKDFISKVQEKDAYPVLVSPMERRRWKNGEPQETLTDFAASVRNVAEEQNVPLIDLHAMSLKLYAALGPEGSKNAFVHYPAMGLKDDTHHNGYGAYELARCVIEDIKTEIPELAKYLRPGMDPFDPSSPDDLEGTGVLSSREVRTRKPEGN